MDDMSENAWCEKAPSLPHLRGSGEGVQLVLRRQNVTTLFAVGG